MTIKKRGGTEASKKKRLKKRRTEGAVSTDEQRRRRKRTKSVNLEERKQPKTKKRVRRKRTSKDLVAAREAVEVLEGEVMANMPIPIKDEAKYMDEYMALFRNLQHMRRMAEKKYRDSKSSRDIYALMALYSQQREVIADIRSVTDLSEHAQLLIQEVLEPMLNAVAQNLLDSFYSVRQILIEATKEDLTEQSLKKAKNITKHQGDFVQEQYELAARKMIQMFAEVK